MALRIVVTGGGTGGHVYPALEVASHARSVGSDVLYLGSVRGQEGGACAKAVLPFVGFPSQPLLSLRTLRGWQGLASLVRARSSARRALRQYRPDVVFSTGGYAAGPVVSAAQSLGVPTVLHEQNAVPGRSNLLFAKRARAVATVFHAAARHFPGVPVERTGMPIRAELRKAAQGGPGPDLLPLVLVVGGSQGARAINEAALGAATRMTGRGLHWIHAAGPAHFEALFASFEKLGLKHVYEVRAFLEVGPLAEAYARCSVVVTRGGAGTLTEIAAFRRPSVVCPYPFAFADHQRHNALELEAMGACVLVDQATLTPTLLEEKLAMWLDDPGRREAAAAALGVSVRSLYRYLA
ncbi:MAG: UDP-N-acetylglucosamine--N-acetylmuramyl-(pentapeptide) pyrophosphoryl-undecaprenol N-acetylglucosamine transferase [Fimbriimonadaceae bacterium]